MQRPIAALSGCIDTKSFLRSEQRSDRRQLVTFLCSDDAEYIVGQTIVADGGTTSLMSLISDFRSESPARCGLGYVNGA